MSAQQSHFFAGNSRGFRGGYASSRHSLSVAPIASLCRAKGGDDMQRDAWYSSMRAPQNLAAPEAVGRYAAERALSRLKSRKIPTHREVPVLFESTLASGLLGAYVQATSGASLYRKASFLLDSLGQAVLPAHVDVVEDPHVPRAKGSAPFDDEGVATRRAVVDGGVVQGYFLASYSARKLGLRTTGHAGGAHNLQLTSRFTAPGDDLDAMLRKLGRGLFVIELMGQGINYVTGDYSRGAAGFWVEGGQIAYPVHGSRSPATCATCCAASPRSAPTPTRWARARSVRCSSSA